MVVDISLVQEQSFDLECGVLSTDLMFQCWVYYSISSQNLLHLNQLEESELGTCD